MKLLAVAVCIIGVVAHGGHGSGGGGGGTAYVSSGYSAGLSYATPSQYSTVAYQPQFYGTSYAQQPQFASVGALPSGPPALPSLGGHGGHGHKHGGQQASYIVAPQRTIIQQPVQHVIQQPQRVIQPIIQPVIQTMQPLGYESEQVEERVYRTPISKTITELPDDVRRIKKTVNQHFPMVHQQLTEHYTIQDMQENNIIHHYYEPKDNYLGMMQGQKFTTGAQHVDHQGEMYQEQPTTVVEEMVVDSPSYETVIEKPITKTVISQRPSYETLITETPRIQEYVTESRTAPLREYISRPVRSAPVLREQFSQSSLREPITVPSSVRRAIYDRN